MKDDLISRRTIKFLIEVIRDCWAISPYVSANDMKLYSKVFNVVLNEISNCPTAFDKEKVIEELEYDKEMSAKYNTGLREQGHIEAFDEAISIVKKGGINNILL